MHKAAPVRSEIDPQSEFWDNFAAYYEQAYEPRSVLIARTLHEHLWLSTARDVLEVGAGAGASALALTPRLSSGTRLVLTDFSSAMLDLMRAKLGKMQRLNGVRIEIMHADAHRLPYGSGTFDRYLANLCLNLTANPELALAEAARVLRPTGRIALSVWGRRANSPLRTIFYDALNQLGIVAPSPPPLAPSPFGLGTEGALRGMLLRAGFNGVLVWYQPMVIPFDTTKLSDIADDLVDTEAVTKQLDPGLLPSIRSKVTELVDQSISIGAPIAIEILMAVGNKSQSKNDQEMRP